MGRYGSHFLEVDTVPYDIKLYKISDSHGEYIIYSH